MRYAIDYLDGLGFRGGDPYFAWTRWGARRRMRRLRREGITAPLVALDGAGRTVESMPRATEPVR